MSAPRPDPLERALPEIAARVARRLLAGGGDGQRLGGIHVTGGAVPRPGSRGAATPGPAGAGPGSDPGPAAGRSRAVVTVECLAGVADGGRFAVPIDALVTALARDEARRRSIELTSTGGGGALRVALGSDHGGFELKGLLAAQLTEQGHRVHDLGTHDEQPVDYPDFAVAVAREVAEGRADVGLCVDGAGIGSAMAANKVPGVRAANCNSVALARNAREHNYANVLTLGGRMVETAAALEIVRAFLGTPFGAQRHGLRVAKIDALDGSAPRRAPISSH
ncbi:RpiB/LacA/LacB family sugar-phosphate isomerase [Engelhardtia mirabilis]|uniref:Ribose-5-phosphate isomerase B n=1 Tax=Engelhardtia mirabilis TaxID=2528011 RepID=A0A518BDI6_9BACT|nr:Ribose-5-phosphate isomerase B [Planctomycetes bacterium Pla133]QDU99374.1 Ribose-5-phosphate isomerase B [Planctomycetes bacterium Pla86]